MRVASLADKGGDVELTEQAKVRESDMSLFRTYVEGFLGFEGDVRGRAANTIKAYRGDLEAFCGWCSRQGVDPLEATHQDLRSYLGELSRAGYSPRTENRHLSAIRGVYGWMCAEGMATSDPAAALASPKQARKLPHTMTDDEVRALLATCDTSCAEGLRDRAFLEMLYATGARIAEVSALDVRDVDFRARQARLFGKGSKERIVPVYEVALDWLQRYLEEGRPELLVRAKVPTSALFVSTRGRRMSAAALRTVFERQVSSAGLDPTLTPHAMRHTYATELLGGGADMRSVQELLGHESLSTTQVYTHLSIERLKDAERLAHPRAE